jgi:adenylate cyclase
MFTDVRGFTRISEQFDPHGLTRFMNRFLTPMTDIIQEHSGTIDKYMGDAIMAFWNAPLDIERHAARGCETALAMQARLTTLNAAWKAEARAAAAHPGEYWRRPQYRLASVGNRPEQRFTHSRPGDKVNPASRLRAGATYAVGVIVGEHRAANRRLATRADLAWSKAKTDRSACLPDGPMQRWCSSAITRPSDGRPSSCASCWALRRALELIDGLTRPPHRLRRATTT